MDPLQEETEGPEENQHQGPCKCLIMELEPKNQSWDLGVKRRLLMYTTETKNC